MGSTEPLFTVMIANARNPSAFSIDHISKYVAEDMRSAPKRMDIWVRMCFSWSVLGF